MDEKNWSDWKPIRKIEFKNLDLPSGATFRKRDVEKAASKNAIRVKKNLNPYIDG